MAQGFGIAAIEGPFADINSVGQDAVESPDTEACPASRAVTAFVQPSHKSLGAQWPRLAITAEVEPENELDRLLLYRVNFQLLLDARTTFLNFHRAIAQRDWASIVKSLDRVFFHRPQDMLGVFPGLVFIKERDDLAHHHLGGVITELLRDGHQPNARFGEFADIHFQAEGIAEKS
ncbi:MAG: hypothetical protein ABS76_19730 [Pelagibacterium sp. SCN 64-44]|nr:MAG: hypothetical protein ABS76_19730 [Pelagibacterium sp. SCN 64-44]